MSNFHLVLPNCENPQQLCLKIGGQTVPVQEHTEETRESAAAVNLALAAIPPSHRKQVNYYAQVKTDQLPQNRLLRAQITSQEPEDHTFKLPILHHLSFYIPEKQMVKYMQKNTTKTLDCNGTSHGNLFFDPKLTMLGAEDERLMQNYTQDWLLRLNQDAALLMTPMDIAKSLIFQHPNLASARPDTAAMVMNDHVAPARSRNPEQYQKVYDLATAISKQGPDKWCYRSNVVNQTTRKEMVYEYDIASHKTGERVEIYDLSDLTLKNSAEPVKGALQTASQDSRLQNQSWHVSQGSTCDEMDADTREKQQMCQQAEADKNGAISWTVKEKTSLSGMEIYADSIKMTQNKFSIDVKNKWLRTLGAYYQLLDDQAVPYGKKTLSTLVAPVDTLMGIPLPVWKTTVECDLPEDASGVQLYFGGLGTSGYDKEVCIEGIALTAVFQLGIPTFFLVIDAGLTSTKVLTKAMKNKAFANQVAQIFVEVTKAAGYNGPSIGLLWSVLEIAGKTIGGILAQKLFEKIFIWIMGLKTEQEIEAEIPIVGWILRIVNVVIDVAQLAQTIAEVCSSPAVISAQATRTMDITTIVRPDPAHGEPDRPETAVWPATADNWAIDLLYRGGTNKRTKGAFPKITTSAPLKTAFAGVPAGGEFKVYASVYSANGWLCGKWESNWIKALPDQGSNAKTVTGAVTEILVPLTSDVQYLYKEKLVYGSGEYSWHEGDKPAQTIKDLGQSGSGEYLCRLDQITYSSYCKQAGYVWNASGSKLPPVDGEKNQAIAYMIQNISVLAKDSVNQRLKTAEIGFSQQPSIAYDKFGAGNDNFILDPRKGQCHLRRVDLMDGKHGFGFSDPGMRSYGKFNQDHLDSMVIHPDGIAVAVNWKNSKMEILEIPEAPASDMDAKEAQLLSGQGIRQGLMDGPVAIKIARDGRILILESGNKRIQGFDTKGNPVPGFLGEKRLEGQLAAYKDDLNGETFTDSLQELFRQAGMARLFTIKAAFAQQLDQATLSEDLLHAFAEEGLYLYSDAQDPEASAAINVVCKGKEWEITEPARDYRYKVLKENDSISLYEWITEMEVKAVKAGETWILRDAAGGRAFLARAEGTNPNMIGFYDYLSYLNLKRFAAADTYLDFCMEGMDYLYVLSYSGSGDAAADYHIDIYQPDGSFLVRTPDKRLQPENPQYPNAAKFEVDEFRNLITLNFEKIMGAGGKPEPSISQWIPTPPLFELEKNQFAQGNMAEIKKTFAQHQITLSANAALSAIKAGEYYRIADVQEISGSQKKVEFDVILCIDKFYIYCIIKK